MNQENQLKVSDIYLTAYLLSQNIPYKEIKRSVKRRVFFVFPSSEKLISHTMKYRTNTATVNVRDFTRQIDNTREAVFEELRSDSDRF